MIDLFDPNLDVNNICLRDGSKVVRIELSNDCVPPKIHAYVYFELNNGLIERRLYADRDGQCHCTNECYYGCGYDIILKASNE